MIRTLFLAALSTAALFAADPPTTPKKPVNDEYHGVKIVDDYRWLENAADPAVKTWTADQTKAARSFLDGRPALPALKKRLKTLMTPSSPRYSGLQKRGDIFFAIKGDPKKDQPYIVALKSLDDLDSARVLVDPNALDPKGKTTIDFYVPSRNGTLVAVSLSENGSEEGTVFVFDTETGKKLPDVLPRINFPTAGGDVAWDADDKGFVYTRYPRGDERPKEDLNFYQQIYHHKIGTDTKDDTYVLGKDFPRIAEICLDSDTTGSYVLATVQLGDGGEFMHHLRGPDGKWKQLTRYEDKVIAGVFGGLKNDNLYLLTRKNAPKGKIIAVPLDKPDLANATTAVKENELNIEGIRFAANRLYPTFAVTKEAIYVVYSDGGPSAIRAYWQGVVEIIVLPSAASVLDVVEIGPNEVLIELETFLAPPGWYLHRSGQMRSQPLTVPVLAQKSPADFSDCEVVREFAKSADGTKVPLSIISAQGRQTRRQRIRRC